MSSVVRSLGTNASEQYLAKLANRTFLNLWSYPNTFNDKGVKGCGGGKELCDLLVVCGDHVLIFSVKSIEWPNVDDVKLAWQRWFERAIRKSAKQVLGAARWIDNFPDRIYLDQACSQPLPLQIPSPERRRVHGIVVALGVGGACKKYFGEGIGSLMIRCERDESNNVFCITPEPFTVGDVNPNGPFVHVFDDVTLDIIMEEFDTITDLTSYLTKKETLIRSRRYVFATGEEELIAY
jgi:hypothetical protein